MSLIGGLWDPASVPALAAIFGSLSGAQASGVSTRITQRHRIDGIFSLSKFSTANSCIRISSVKVRTPWLMPSNITFKTRISSPRPMHF